jgi:hypothetical protein
MVRRPTAAQVRRSLKTLVDESVGYATERRDHLIAVTTLARASFGMIAKA